VSESEDKVQMSLKQMGVLIGVLAGLATVHGTVMVPIIRSTVHGDIENALDHHEERPHKDAVSRHEFEQIRADLREFRQEMRAQVSRLEAAVGD